MITFKQYLNEGFVDKALGVAIGVGATNDPKGLNNNWLNNFTHHYNQNMSFEHVQ
jgi:hypothetical protein